MKYFKFATKGAFLAIIYAEDLDAAMIMADATRHLIEEQIEKNVSLNVHLGTIKGEMFSAITEDIVTFLSHERPLCELIIEDVCPNDQRFVDELVSEDGTITLSRKDFNHICNEGAIGRLFLNYWDATDLQTELSGFLGDKQLDEYVREYAVDLLGIRPPSIDNLATTVPAPIEAMGCRQTTVPIRPTYRLCAHLTLNRPLKDSEHISPGGYTISTKDGESYTFDFVEYSSWNDDFEKTGLSIRCKNPDYSYENTSEITMDVASKIVSFDDFYIDLEGCEPDLKIMSLDSIKFEYLTDALKLKIVEVSVDEMIVEECSKKMFGE